MLCEVHIDRVNDSCNLNFAPAGVDLSFALAIVHTFCKRASRGFQITKTKMTTLNQAGNPVLNLNRDVDPFTKAYIECALWSSNDESNEQGGDPLDKNYNWTHLADETLAKMIADCAKFQTDNSALLAVCGNPEQNGHDLWLTRNHHGAGFWDRDYSDIVAQQITERAHAMSEFNLYVGDDGKIYS